jgi:bifunctional non-homologous end joining protein LigD
MREKIHFTNLGKVLFPDDGITKGDVIEYYGSVADRMLPYLRDHPIAMARYPDGITRQRIFQKNPAEYYPDWVTSVEVKKQGGTLRHVVCDKAATLLYLANQACIEVHVFLSRTGSLDCPDQLVVDFDPPEAGGFGTARRCALWLRKLFDDELGLTCYVRTTGGKGLHVHLPLNGREDFDSARRFAHEAAAVLAARHPDVITTEQRKEARTGRVYADVMRNSYAQTVVAP